MELSLIVDALREINIDLKKYTNAEETNVMVEDKEELEEQAKVEVDEILNKY